MGRRKKGKGETAKRMKHRGVEKREQEKERKRGEEEHKRQKTG